MEVLVVAWLVVAAGCAIVGMVIGAGKCARHERNNNSEWLGVAGFFAGAIFGPLGVLLMLLVPRSVAREAERQRAIQREIATQQGDAAGSHTIQPLDRWQG